MVAHADYEANSRPYLRMRKRVRRPWHSPFLSAIVAVREFRLVDVDDVHSCPEQLDEAQGILLSENEISIPIAGERDSLDPFIPHAELFLEYLLHLMGRNVLKR